MPAPTARPAAAATTARDDIGSVQTEPSEIGGGGRTWSGFRLHLFSRDARVSARLLCAPKTRRACMQHEVLQHWSAKQGRDATHVASLTKVATALVVSSGSRVAPAAASARISQPIMDGNDLVRTKGQLK